MLGTHRCIKPQTTSTYSLLGISKGYEMVECAPSLVTSVDLSRFRDLVFSDFADTDQRIVPAGGTDGLCL